MDLVQYFIIVILITTCWSKARDTNEISEKQLSTKLDANLRKALLKALNELETDNKSKLDQGLRQTLKPVNSFSVDSILPNSFVNGVFQKAPASTISIIAQSASSTTEKINTAPNTSEKSIVVVQQSSGVQHRPITSFVPTITPNFYSINDSEQIIASASSSFTGSSKFQSLKNDLSQERSVSDRVSKNLVSLTEKSRISKPEITTTTPIITSSTEESEAKAEDVQFFAAPLVAAFTVHQDEQGLPKKQEQLRIQHDLEAKQRVLEQQIRTLQQQQQHQDYLLRQQQLLHEQNLLQQRQKILEDQKVLLKQQPHTTPQSLSIFPSTQTVLHNQFNHHLVQDKIPHKSFSNSVFLEPSIEFRPTTQVETGLVLPSVVQQLPNKGATNFRQNIFQQIQLPLVDEFIQPPRYRPFANQLFARPQLNSFQSPPVREFQNFNFKETSTSAPQSNRVFRHESGTSNFVNLDYNRNNFNTFINPAAISHANRFFRSNPETFSITPSVSQDFHSFRNIRRPANHNNQLNNLLYYSGVTKAGQPEDFNIVSKVLSLNHLGGDNFFGSSQILEQRLTPPRRHFVKT
ncbi:hypothetical protein ILUMI_24639 [Ignelater luminosus]|uniref:Uncharacterized protein n=1 Tax=Ignelater luminosus TaxID=2038154 RepID=A0A8K0G0G0_IGNLU|nr:hypothetical protein ILUMI_24639 [Ignelater luminosus]